MLSAGVFWVYRKNCRSDLLDRLHGLIFVGIEHRIASRRHHFRQNLDPYVQRQRRSGDGISRRDLQSDQKVLQRAQGSRGFRTLVWDLSREPAAVSLRNGDGNAEIIDLMAR